MPMHPDERDRFSNQVLHALKQDGIEVGKKSGKKFAGRFILSCNEKKDSWSWGVTSEYPVVSNLSSNIDEIVNAYDEAVNVINGNLMPAAEFENQCIGIIESMGGGDALIRDVAKKFKSNAVFLANLIMWKHDVMPNERRLEFTPATLNQAWGRTSRAFLFPQDRECTELRPMIFMKIRD